MRHSHYSIIKSTPSQILESGNLLVIRYSGENLFLKEEVCPLSSCALKSLLLLFIFFSFCVYMFSIARECLCGLVCVCASASRCLSMEELYRNRSGFFFFFFLIRVTIQWLTVKIYTSAIWRKILYSDLKFHKLNKVKYQYFFSAETLVSPVFMTVEV